MKEVAVEYDAAVVGAGPNGLAAAVTLARAGRSVVVFEAARTVGGGARTAELTLPGFRHDVCSAVHPLAVGSPFFRSLPLHEHGLEWVHPDHPLGHPLSPREAVVVHRSIVATEAGLDESDAEEYRRRVGSVVDHWDELESQLFGPLLRIPDHIGPFLRFSLVGGLPATQVMAGFSSEAAKAVFAGAAAHSYLPLNRPLTAAFGLLYLATAHKWGWPVARGGSQAIVDALASLLRSLGGEIVTDRPVSSLAELPPTRAVLLDTTPGGLEAITGERLPAGYRRRLAAFRHGPAAFKVDYALAEPVPWANRELEAVGTIHLGTSRSIVAAESAIWDGRHPEQPFTLVSQPSRFDPSRAPAGSHTLWAYCHVPSGSTRDYTEAIEEEIEELAPGFRSSIRARCVSSPADLEAYNPNYVNGDITGGAHLIRQLVFRPVVGRNPYATPLPGVYLCSSSTPPGAGVHGMCGWWAATTALGRELA
jgi:phytoene dehydrogenase-like protein